MTPFLRSDTSRIAEWWRTIDRPLLGALTLLIMIGILMIFAAGPGAAGRLGLSTWHFVIRQMIFLMPALGVMLVLSMLDVREIKRIGLALLAAALTLVVATHLFAPEVNGATRWLFIGPFSLQPSELLKPGLIICTAALLAAARREDEKAGYVVIGLLYAVCAGLVLAQKDFGQTVLISIAFGAQLFMAGLPFLIVIGLGIAAVGGLVLVYMFMPHVTARIDRFLDPSSENYQVERAYDAFAAGGLFGRGPGEGVVKSQLPDAHTDYIFAVAGEELGAIVCLLILLVYLGIMLRGLSLSHDSSDLFVQLATGGLVVSFGIQASINLAVNLDLVPSKGMTLPFISYGGSSLLALGIGMGFLLALTRRRLPGRLAQPSGGGLGGFSIMGLGR
ncbi:MAG: putative peptidoglycan glycosyltransferase FtsW [Alphaproteobacteria bacterium]